MDSGESSQQQGRKRPSKQEKKAFKKLTRNVKKAEKKAKDAKIAAVIEDVVQEDDIISKGAYGNASMHLNEIVGRELISIKNLGPANINQTVWLRGRLLMVRADGVNHGFFVLRQHFYSVLCLVYVSETISKQMVKFILNVPMESVLEIEGTFKSIGPFRPLGKIKKPLFESCSQKHIALLVTKVFVISKSLPSLPFQINQVVRPVTNDDGERLSVCVNQGTRPFIRVLSLRISVNQAIFRLKGGVFKLFRDLLGKKNFVEIHTPKIISEAARKSGANVFEGSYFKDSAYLAQSLQLYKQMAISSDFGRVFTVAAGSKLSAFLLSQIARECKYRLDRYRFCSLIAFIIAIINRYISTIYQYPQVFRDTHRHLFEFVGIDLEMAFNYHYHEVVDVIGEMFVELFKGLRDNFADEIAVVNRKYPTAPFVFLEHSLRLEYREALDMLREDGVEIGDEEDLSTPVKKRLGCLVKAKYSTDFYILDKYPLAVRSFFTMPDPINPKYSNSYAMFMRGEEIMSGAQAIHDADYLTARATSLGIGVKKIKYYIACFQYGCSPHAGGGIDLEKLTMVYLGLDNIRKISMFPRDVPQ